MKYKIGDIVHIDANAQYHLDRTVGFNSSMVPFLGTTQTIEGVEDDYYIISGWIWPEKVLSPTKGTINASYDEIVTIIHDKRKELDALQKQLEQLSETRRLKTIATGKSAFAEKFNKLWKTGEISPYWGGDGSEEEMQNIIIEFVTKYKYEMRFDKPQLEQMLGFWDDVIYL